MLDIVPELYAAAPQLTARLRIQERSGAAIHAMALRCQVRIRPSAEVTTPTRKPACWNSSATAAGGRHSRAFMWMHCGVLVQGFRPVDVDLPLPCTFDFEVSAAKYLIPAGRDIPLEFLFSGTIFTRGAAGFGVEQIPWDREAPMPCPWRSGAR